MEKSVKSTAVGIFDMDMSLCYSRDGLTPESEICNFPEIAIIDYEIAGWTFFKNSDDARMIATTAFAEGWARCMQSRSPDGKNLEDIWEDCAKAVYSEFVTSHMKYFAVRLLSRYWVHGDALRKVFDDYWNVEGQARVDAQNELLEAHLA